MRRRWRWFVRDVSDELRIDPGDELRSADERDVVGQALACLSPEHRLAVVLRYYRDLTVDEIADRLGVPAGTVKSRLHYALRQLQDALDAAEAKEALRASVARIPDAFPTSGRSVRSRFSPVFAPASILIVLGLLLAMALAAFAAGSPDDPAPPPTEAAETEPDDPFVGTWESVDIDGSAQCMTIRHPEDGAYKVEVFDDESTACGGCRRPPAAPGPWPQRPT